MPVQLSTMAGAARVGRVALLGGRGFLGRAITRALLAAPDAPAVRVVTRGGKGTRVSMAGTETMVADVGTSDGMHAALAGCTAAVNLIGLLYETHPSSTFARAHTGVAQNLTSAAGNARVVHLSAIGADAGSRSAYARTKAAAEAALAPLGAVVLRPSIVYGSEDSFFNRFASMARFSPFLPLVGGGGTRYQPVHVDDVAAAVLRALRVGEDAVSPGVYELGGTDVRTFRELMEMVLRVSGRRRALISIPYPIAATQGALFEALHSLVPAVPPLLTRDQVELLKTDNVVHEGAKGFSELGIVPRGCSDKDIAYIAGG